MPAPHRPLLTLLAVAGLWLASRLRHSARRRSRRPAWPVTFVDVADAARASRTPSVYGGVERKRFIIETNGAGVALLDYDGDGWLDALVLERHAADARARATIRRWPAGQAPTQRLYRNRRDGTFADVTRALGPRRDGLGVVGLRRRLRQRRRASICSRHRVRHQRALPQSRRRPRSRTSRRAAGLPAAGHALGLGLHVPRLRPRRPARPVRRELPAPSISRRPPSPGRA